MSGAVEARFVDQLLGSGHHDDVAIIESGQAHTYGELRSAVGCLESRVAAFEFSGPPRIGIYGPNSFSWVVAYLAALRVGTAVPVAGPARFAVEQLTQVDAELVFARPAEAAELQAAGLKLPVLAPEQSGGSVAAHRSEHRAAAEAVLMFTSGSTARPRAVRLTEQNLQANTAAILACLGVAATDRMLVLLPFHHAFGASLLHTHLAIGASLVLSEGLALPQRVVQSLAEFQCTGLAGVPSTYRLLLRASGFAKQALPHLRQLQQAGGRLEPAEVLSLAQAQPTAQLFVMYGQTEATARIAYLPPELVRQKPGSVGRAVPGVELRVAGPDGLEVAPGEVGEILVRGASVSPGYLDDPGATAEHFRDGWLWTGDLARRDDDGDLHLSGRRTGFIKTWGHRVAPQRIEQAALAEPEVMEAVALGVPDPVAGESIVLVLVGAIEAIELRQRLAGSLPAVLVPKRIIRLPELPLNASGKVDLVGLRALAMSQSGGR